MDFHIFLTDYQPMKNRSNAISGNPTWKTSVVVAALSHLRIPVSTKRTCKKHAVDFSDHPGSRSAPFAYHPRYPTILLNSAPSSRNYGILIIFSIKGTWNLSESDLSFKTMNQTSPQPPHPANKSMRFPKVQMLYPSWLPRFPSPLWAGLSNYKFGPVLSCFSRFP